VRARLPSSSVAPLPLGIIQSHLITLSPLLAHPTLSSCLPTDYNLLS
jgi:hypothetical protein